MSQGLMMQLRMAMNPTLPQLPYSVHMIAVSHYSNVLETPVGEGFLYLLLSCQVTG